MCWNSTSSQTSKNNVQITGLIIKIDKARMAGKKTADKIAIIIPARYDSTRFPGKVLADVLGKPMIRRVYERAAQSRYASDVFVATDDERVKKEVLGFGGRVIMTSSGCKTGTDRIAEAAQKIDADIIVNVQGDEPVIDPKSIDKAIEPMLKDEQIMITNAIVRISDKEEIADANNVKAVVDKGMNIMYFSRLPIPGSKKKDIIVQTYKQTGIYSFRKDFLTRFSRMKQTPLELREGVELMRVLENGIKIRAVVVESNSISVDVLSDIDKVAKYIKEHNIK